MRAFTTCITSRSSVWVCLSVERMTIISHVSTGEIRCWWVNKENKNSSRGRVPFSLVSKWCQNQCFIFASQSLRWFIQGLLLFKPDSKYTDSINLIIWNQKDVYVSIFRKKKSPNYQSPNHSGFNRKEMQMCGLCWAIPISRLELLSIKTVARQQNTMEKGKRRRPLPRIWGKKHTEPHSWHAITMSWSQRCKHSPFLSL